MNPIPDPWHGGLVGVKLTETDASERTVLHHAAACGHKHIVEWVCPKLKKPMKALSPLDPDPHVDANSSPLMADVPVAMAAAAATASRRTSSSQSSETLREAPRDAEAASAEPSVLGALGDGVSSGGRSSFSREGRR